MKKQNNKQRLFEVMGKLDKTFKPKLNENWFDEDDIENIDNNKINDFVGKLPNDFPNLVRSYSKDKNIGLDAAYYQFLGAFMEKLGIDLNDDEIEELDTYMYGKFGDNKIEF